MAAKIFPITRLSNTVIRVLGSNPGPMTLQGTNTYLLGTGNKRILIDTGDANVPKYVNDLKQVLLGEEASIQSIILTHWHHDHIGGVNEVVRLCAPESCVVWKYPRIDEIDVFPQIASHITIKKLRNKQEFCVEGARIKIVYTPGHTSDHVVISMDGTLFSGDSVLGEGTAVFEDLYDYMKSLELILRIKPNIIYPGHGNIIKDPTERITYYIDHRNQREGQIVELFRRNSKSILSVSDIVKRIYKDTSKKLWPAAANNVRQHLKKLEKEDILLKSIKSGISYWKIIK